MANRFLIFDPRYKPDQAIVESYIDAAIRGNRRHSVAGSPDSKIPIRLSFDDALLVGDLLIELLRLKNPGSRKRVAPGPTPQTKERKRQERLQLFLQVLEKEAAGMTRSDAINSIPLAREADKVRNWFDKGTYRVERNRAAEILKHYPDRWRDIFIPLSAAP